MLEKIYTFFARHSFIQFQIRSAILIPQFSCAASFFHFVCAFSRSVFAVYVEFFEQKYILLAFIYSFVLLTSAWITFSCIREVFIMCQARNTRTQCNAHREVFATEYENSEKSHAQIHVWKRMLCRFDNLFTSIVALCFQMGWKRMTNEVYLYVTCNDRIQLVWLRFFFRIHHCFASLFIQTWNTNQRQKQKQTTCTTHAHIIMNINKFMFEFEFEYVFKTDE